MRFGSLLSGIGGLDLGLERAGMRCTWQVEIDDFCRSILAKHWPDVPKYGDIREVNFTQLDPIDLICGGFPCQPFSVAGKREGQNDDRYLWPEFARAIGEARPRIVLLENVPGLLSIDSGRIFGRVLADLAGLGFDVEWDCIPAAAVGAPHLRYRVIVVAYSSSTRCRSGQPGEDRPPRDSAWGQEPERLGGPLADAQGIGCDPRRPEPAGEQGRPSVDGGRSSLPNSWGHGLERGISPGAQASHGRRPADSRCQRDASHAHRQPTFGPPVPWQECAPWPPEPDVGRLAYGLPARLATPMLRGLGNAVVPQIAEWVGKRIMEAKA